MKNYFKNFFKSFSIFQIVVIALVFVAVAVGGQYAHKFFSNKALISIMKNVLRGGLYFMIAAFAVLGATQIKSKKLSMIDLFRISTILGIVGILVFLYFKDRITVNTSVLYIAALIVLAAEVLIRSLVSKTEPTTLGWKGYVSSIAKRFNPILMFVVGVVIGVLIILFVEPSGKLVKFFMNYYWGILAGSLVLMMIVLPMVGGEEANIVDAIAITLVVALVTVSFFGLSKGFPYVKFPVLALGVAFATLIRGMCFQGENKPCKCKFCSYYGGVYAKYDVAFPIVIALLIIGFIYVPTFHANVVNSVLSSVFSSLKGKDVYDIHTWFVIAGMALAAITFLGLFVSRKVKDSKIVFTDYLLMVMTFVSIFFIPYLVNIAMDFNTYFELLLADIVSLIALVVLFIVAVATVVLTVIRVKNYNCVCAVAEEETVETEVVEEVVEEEALENEEETEDDVEEDLETEETVEVDNVVANKTVKRKFNTRMMLATDEAKSYYSEVKNYLQAYRAKGRISSKCETFRYKGLVAKVGLAGKSVKVYLALNPQELEGSKYHFKDASAKKQYAEVPVLIKVKSPRGLKYFKELVDMLMAKRAIKPKRNYVSVDYTKALIPNGEAIFAELGLNDDYLYDTIHVKNIPADLPDDLGSHLPITQGEKIEEELVYASVYLDTLCNHYNDGDVVTMEDLKARHIITRGNALKVKARGTLDRKLVIYAEDFESDALKMLLCTNGTAVKILR